MASPLVIGGVGAAALGALVLLPTKPRFPLELARRIAPFAPRERLSGLYGIGVGSPRAVQLPTDGAGARPFQEGDELLAAAREARRAWQRAPIRWATAGAEIGGELGGPVGLVLGTVIGWAIGVFEGFFPPPNPKVVFWDAIQDALRAQQQPSDALSTSYIYLVGLLAYGRREAFVHVQTGQLGAIWNRGPDPRVNPLARLAEGRYASPIRELAQRSEAARGAPELWERTVSRIPGTQERETRPGSSRPAGEGWRAIRWSPRPGFYAFDFARDAAPGHDRFSIEQTATYHPGRSPQELGFAGPMVLGDYGAAWTAAARFVRSSIGGS